MLHDKQLFNKVPFQSTKNGKKELCVGNIKTIGDACCPTCRNEEGVYSSTNKTTSFYVCKNCKACCSVLNIPFKDQKRTFFLSGGDGTQCLHESRLRKTISSMKFLRQSQPSTSEPESKKLKGVQIRNKVVRFLLVDDLNHIFVFQINLFKFNQLSTSQF